MIGSLAFRDFLGGVEPDCDNYLSYRDYLSKHVSFSGDNRYLFDSATERIRSSLVNTSAPGSFCDGPNVNRGCVGLARVDRFFSSDVRVGGDNGTSFADSRAEGCCCYKYKRASDGGFDSESCIGVATCVESTVRGGGAAEFADVGNGGSVSDTLLLVSENNCDGQVPINVSDSSESEKKKEKKKEIKGKKKSCENSSDGVLADVPVYSVNSGTSMKDSDDQLGLNTRFEMMGGASGRLSDDQLGPNTLRNRKIRQEKKERKMRRKAVCDEKKKRIFFHSDQSSRLDQIVGKRDWRDGERISRDSRDAGSQGFWKSCSDDVRQQLIDSKARMHIAENQRRQVDAELKFQQGQAALSAANSVPALVSQMVAVSKLANQLVRTTKDDQVHGWAKTVADSLTKSVAESAISRSDSLPSLESVGYGDSALRSSDGESVKSRRLLLYQAKVEEFQKLVDDDRFDTVNQEVMYKRDLDDEYADVLLSEQEFFEKKMTDGVINYFMSNGKGLEETERAIVGIGLPRRDLHADFYSNI